MNSRHYEQDQLETEGSCLNTEEPKVLTFDTEKEKLTLERIKVILLCDFLVDLCFRDLPPNVISTLNWFNSILGTLQSICSNLFFPFRLCQLAHICHLLCCSTFC